jgi:hypothetical protein
MRLIASAFLTTVLLTPQGVAAQIVDNGSETLDSSTGLVWLDVSLTVNRSFVYVNSQFGPGGEFDGWRYATADEVRTFWTNAGIPVLTGAFVTENFDPVSALMALTGLTSLPATFSNSRGMVSPPLDGRVSAPTLIRDEFTTTASAAVPGTMWLETTEGSFLGSWLVKDATPGPPDPDPVPTVVPHDMLAALISDVAALDLQKGLTNSLMAKLQAATKNVEDGNVQNNGGAVGPLSAFINEVNAQTGKHLDEADAGGLIADAQAIIDALNN